MFTHRVAPINVAQPCKTLVDIGAMACFINGDFVKQDYL
jgi:hypothetical protein